MSNKLYEETAVSGIADAIRAKNGSSDTYTIGEMADAIENLDADTLATYLMGTLTAYYSDAVTTVVQYGLKQESYYASGSVRRITSIRLPNCVSLGYCALQNNIFVNDLYLPNLETMDAFACQRVGYVLSNGTTFEISLPKLQAVSRYGLAETKMTRLDLGEDCASIGEAAFMWSDRLAVLILRKTDAIVTLSNTNAFSNCGINSSAGYCTVYVPDDLKSTYEADSTWASAGVTFANLSDLA